MEGCVQSAGVVSGTRDELCGDTATQNNNSNFESLAGGLPGQSSYSQVCGNDDDGHEDMLPFGPLWGKTLKPGLRRGESRAGPLQLQLPHVLRDRQINLAAAPPCDSIETTAKLVSPFHILPSILIDFDG
jgi:hypothetical protein